MGQREEFLNEENRIGFAVDKNRKKLWNTQLGLLEKLDKCCRENGIRYFAAFGTLMGAVRHKGFIPWDDDMDLCMMRPDYQRFLQVAPEYFEEPVFFQNYYTDKRNNCVTSFSRLRDSRTTMIETRFAGCAGFNQGIFIDIFPFDMAPAASAEADTGIFKVAQELWCAIVDPRFLLEQIIAGNEPLIGTDTTLDILGMPFEERLTLYESTLAGQFGRAGRVNLFSDIHVNSGFRISCFDKTLYVPFEYTMIPVPAGYDEVLATVYGNYQIPLQRPTVHEVALIDPDRPYTDYISP